MSKARRPKSTLRIKQVQQFCEEFFDGVALVGFIAGTTEQVKITIAGDPKTEAALRGLVASWCIPPSESEHPNEGAGV